jgi:hypothetical protein
MVTASRWSPCHRQLDVIGQVAWGLGGNVNSAKLCYLGVSVDDAKHWIHFLKSFDQGIFEKNPSKKGL